jgi:hypothetical protein
MASERSLAKILTSTSVHVLNRGCGQRSHPVSYRARLRRRGTNLEHSVRDGVPSFFGLPQCGFDVLTRVAGAESSCIRAMNTFASELAHRPHPGVTKIKTNWDLKA